MNRSEKIEFYVLLALASQGFLLVLLGLCVEISGHPKWGLGVLGLLLPIFISFGLSIGIFFIILKRMFLGQTYTNKTFTYVLLIVTAPVAILFIIPLIVQLFRV